MPTFATPEPISVTLELGVCDIRIAASDRTDTAVEVRPSNSTKKADVAAAEQTQVEYANGRLLVKAPSRRQFSLRGGRESIDVVIGLPAGSRLDGNVGVATVRSTGRLGDCRIKTGAGAIRLDEAGSVVLKTGIGDVEVGRAGDTEVATGSGAVSVGAVEGTAVIKTSNGEARLGRVTGDLRVSSANGKIIIEHAGGTVAAKTANGDILIGEVVRGAIVAHTACGKVEVGVRDGVAAWLDLNTHFGTVRNELHDADAPAQGQESVDVNARTSYGDITIRRCLPAGAAGPAR